MTSAFMAADDPVATASGGGGDATVARGTRRSGNGGRNDKPGVGNDDGGGGDAGAGERDQYPTVMEMLRMATANGQVLQTVVRRCASEAVNFRNKANAAPALPQKLFAKLIGAAFAMAAAWGSVTPNRQVLMAADRALAWLYKQQTELYAIGERSAVAGSQRLAARGGAAGGAARNGGAARGGNGGEPPQQPTVGVVRTFLGSLWFLTYHALVRAAALVSTVAFSSPTTVADAVSKRMRQARTWLVTDMRSRVVAWPRAAGAVGGELVAAMRNGGGGGGGGGGGPRHVWESLRNPTSKLRVAGRRWAAATGDVLMPWRVQLASTVQ